MTFIATKVHGLKKIGCFLVAAFLLQNCFDTGFSEPNDEIDGDYIFKYPSGIIEVLTIKNQPRTYNQTFYSNEKDFVNKNAALYENKSTWVATGLELEFDNWLSICYLGRFTDSILTKPEIVDMHNVHWYKKLKQIDVSFEEGYVLKKASR
jgi:hypothetical protein